MVAALAYVTGRPVKWLETGRENLTCAAQAREQRVEVELASDRSGVVLALRARAVSDAGAYHLYPVTALLDPVGTAGILPGPYRTDAYAWEALAVATNKPPLGAYRGVGMTMGVFVMERMLDLLAGRLGLDPAELRRRNLIRPEAYPFMSASGMVYDSGNLPAALEGALTLADYERLRKEQAEAREHGRLVGVGLACYTEYTGLGSVAYRRRGSVHIAGTEAATVKMDADGSVRCFLSFPSQGQGQGHATVAAQLLAAELGIRADSVTVCPVDTADSPAGSGTFASHGAIAEVGAVGRAAAILREKLTAIAARLLEASADDLELRDGDVGVRGVPDRRVSLAEVARVAYAAGALSEGVEPGLEATAHFDPPGPTFAGGVHVASVEVDRETGRVRVRDYVVVKDCGRCSTRESWKARHTAPSRRGSGRRSASAWSTTRPGRT